MRKFTASALALAALTVLAGMPVARSGPPSDRSVGPRWCRDNLLKNGDFAAGMVLVGNGSMPASKLAHWTASSRSPQVRAGPGCGDSKGFISMWGNQTVGEAIQQKLQKPLEKGKTYRFSACVRWLENKPELPKYVRFRVHASNGPIPYNVGPVVGTTGAITSKSWSTITLPDWTATGAFDTITIHPDNDNEADDGKTVSWGQIDRVCIREIPHQQCRDNLLRNGGFAAGMVLVGNGSMPASKVAHWTASSRSPQVRAGPGCGDSKGFISMWGNQAVGEAIQQKLQKPLEKGKTYRFSACVRWLENKPELPQYVRFRVRASNGTNTAVVGITGAITSKSWATITLPDWKATGAFDTITINPENDNKANDGKTVSWGQIDSVCLQEIRVRERRGPGE